MKTDHLQEIVQIFETSSLSKMELEMDDMKIKLEKQTGCTEHFASMVEQVPAASTKAAVSEDEEKDVEEVNGTWIKSPIVGTFYASRVKGSAPFVEIGQSVKKGDVLCIIEAMKVMNEIHSPVDGIVRSILVTNESMVEFDQDLIRIGE